MWTYCISLSTIHRAIVTLQFVFIHFSFILLDNIIFLATMKIRFIILVEKKIQFIYIFINTLLKNSVDKIHHLSRNAHNKS